MQRKCSMRYARDFPKMTKFYEKMLDAMPVNTEWIDSWAFFETGLAVHAIPRDHARDSEQASFPETSEKRLGKLIFIVENVEAERTRLEGMAASMLPRQWQEPTRAR